MMLSTLTFPRREMTKVLRKRKAPVTKRFGEEEYRDIPEVISLYHNNMNGFDVADALIALYKKHFRQYRCALLPHCIT